MINGTDLIKVTNRDSGSVGYTIPDLNNLHRSFKSGETKEIQMEELRKLCFNTTAGRAVISKYLVIHNKEAVKELLNNVEPEYYYTDEDIKKLLVEGSLAQLEDCLNFGTAGVLNLVKKYAVELEIDEYSKRDLISKKLDFNIDNAIRIKREAQEDEDNENQEIITRKATPITETTTVESEPVRRTSPIEYNVVK